MTSRIRLVRALLIGICLQALTGCLSGTTLAAVSQAPPIQAGLCHGNSISHALKVKARHGFMPRRRHLATLQ
jgi:hypothetical protein